MKRQGFLRGSAILLAMVMITKILGILYKIPLTNLLGGTGMGCFSGAFSVFTPVFAIIVSGIPSTISRLSAENYALGRYRNLRKLKRTAMLLFVPLSVVAAALLITFSGFLSVHVIHEPNAKLCVAAASLSIIFCTVMSVERGYYEGLRNMLPTALSEICETVCRLLLGLGGAYYVSKKLAFAYESGHAVMGKVCETSAEAASQALPAVAAAAILGSSLASAVACIYIIVSGKIKGDGITKKMLLSDKSADSFSYAAGGMIKLCAPIAFVSLIVTFTGMIDMLTVNPEIAEYCKADSSHYAVLVGNGLTFSQIPNFVYGSYMGLAVAVYGLVPSFTAMLGKSVLPSLAEECASGKKENAVKSLEKMLLLSSMIAFPTGLGISVFARDILNFLFGGRTKEVLVAAPALTYLGLAVVFLSLAMPCFTVVQTLGKPMRLVFIMLLGGAVKLLLNILLIGKIGIVGGALSALASDFVICLLTLINVFKMFHLKCRFVLLYFKPFYAAVMCVVGAYLCKRVLMLCCGGLNHRVVLCISVLFGALIYCAFILVLYNVTKNDKVKKILKKVS